MGKVDKYDPPVEDPGRPGGEPMPGGGGGTPDPSGAGGGSGPPSAAISVGADGGLVAEVDGLYTERDHHDGHRHAIMAQNFNDETGNGVTEVEGGPLTSIPPHTHAIIGFIVQPYQRGAYISIHG